MYGSNDSFSLRMYPKKMDALEVNKNAQQDKWIYGVSQLQKLCGTTL